MATSSSPRIASAPGSAPAAAVSLRDEAVRFGRYLIGVPPSDELAERYASAHAHVLREPPTQADRAVLEFVHAHPWSLPLLDAGTALMRSAPLLRRKLLVMMAILETTPEHADRTLPVDGVPLPRLVLRLGRAAAAAALKAGAGAALAAVVTRHARASARGGG